MHRAGETLVRGADNLICQGRDERMGAMAAHRPLVDLLQDAVSGRPRLGEAHLHNRRTRSRLRPDLPEVQNGQETPGPVELLKLGRRERSATGPPILSSSPVCAKKNSDVRFR